MSDSIRPFPIHVPDESNADLHRRLDAVRWPNRETVNDWTQGVPLAALQELVAHWRSAYDWRGAEAWINASGSSVTEIDGIDIHFLHIRSPHAEARPLLDGVCRENFKHDFGFSLMAYAEALTALNETDAAFDIWKHVVENNSYARAKVQYAELCLKKQQPDLARAQLKDVINDDNFAPAYQRRRDRVWTSRARSLLRSLPAAGAS